MAMHKDSFKSPCHGHALRRMTAENGKSKENVLNSDPTGHKWNVNQVYVVFLSVGTLQNHKNRYSLETKWKTVRLLARNKAEWLSDTGMALPNPRGWCSQLKSFQHWASKSDERGLWANSIWKSHASARLWWNWLWKDKKIQSKI